jgi:hypothetical protein
MMNSARQANFIFISHATRPSHASIPLQLPNKKLSLCDQLNHTTSLSNLPLGLFAEPSCAHNEGDFWETALAQNFAVSEGYEIEDGDGVFLGAFGEVFVALLGWDQGPEL